MSDTAVAPPGPRPVRRRRSRWRLVLVAGGLLLVAYYTVVLVGVSGQDSRDVALEERDVAHPRDRVTLQVEAVDLDTNVGAFDLQVRPVPHGELEAEAAGRLEQPLQVQLSAPGQPPTSFDFPADQLIDPVAASVEVATNAHRFPFDRTPVELRLSARSDEAPVPVDLELTDDAEGWNLSGVARGGDGEVRVELTAQRELLAISFALFYIAGAIVVTLIAVAVIGGAVNRGEVDFERVIWLGAMLVVIPAVRNEMPGVPPIGTAVDLFVFLPSVAVVALALLAAIAVLLGTEATARAATADRE